LPYAVAVFRLTRRGTIMKRICILICTLVLSLSATVRAHSFHRADLTCPICGTQFVAAELGTHMTSGGTDEGRPRAPYAIILHTVHSCPHCHYSGQLHVFKIKDNKYYKLSLPNAKQVKAIGAMLAERKGLRPGKVLYPVERFVIAERCLEIRQAKPAVMLNMALMCAWMCDDAGEDLLAVKYRKKALAYCLESLKDKELTGHKRMRRRKLRWAITSNIGKNAEALRGLTTLLAEVRKEIEARRKSLPPKPKGFDEADGELPYELSDRDNDDGDSRGLFDPGLDRPDKDPPMDPKKKARLKKIWEAWFEFDELRDAASAVEHHLIPIRYKTLDPVAALAIAQKGTYAERSSFVEVYKSSGDPKIIAAIKAFIDSPLGKRPKSVDRDEFEERQERRREWLIRMILDGDDTSAKLREYAYDRGVSEGFFQGDQPDDPRENGEREVPFKGVSSADLASSLANAWKSVNRKESMYYWKVPRDVLAELARRSDKSDKKATAALIANFEEHIDWFTAMLEEITGDWFPKHVDDRKYDETQGCPAETAVYFERFYKTLARDPKLITAAARRLVDKARSGNIKGAAAVVGIMPLGYIKTKESGELLIKAAKLADPAATFAAAKCLLLRNDATAGKALVKVILTHRRWDLPADKTADTCAAMLKGEEGTVLQKLKKLYLDDPKYVRPSLASGRRERGMGVPIRLIAKLAKRDPNQANIYEAFIADIGRPERRPDNKLWPGSTGGYKADKLIEASKIYHRPSISRQFAVALDHVGATSYGHHDIGYMAPYYISFLVKLGGTDSVQAIAKLLNRPTPGAVKAAIIRASDKLDIPGVREKMAQWSNSRHKQLANFTREALAGKNKSKKK